MTAAAPEPRRLTPTERLHAVTLAALMRAPAAPESSVAISRNARGVFQFEVTVRGGNAYECEGDATAILDALVKRYPYPAGPTNGGETT